MLNGLTSESRFGVMHFSYANSSLVEEVAREGHASINLGDYMQTLAVRNLYQKLGIPADQIVTVDRDNLPACDGPPVILVMNACFFRRSFPIPESIFPVFVGFQAKEPIIVEFAEYFRRHAPIGCRDADTKNHFEKLGIAAYVTGCLTLGLEARPTQPKAGRPIIVCGTGPGAFPADALKYAPDSLLSKAEFVFQRKIIHQCPMTPAEMIGSERYAACLLNQYRTRASVVISALHHVIAPAAASGIPVLLCRKSDDTRFSFLKTLVELHLPPSFSAIQWNPTVLDLTVTKMSLFSMARTAIESALSRSN